ncbi:MAG: hypothetical protein N4A74_18255 [Carboxylicivirga sp.]|jgi:hypothetical protein|nr:hypothetical protein [Carboxylicivirga sp.]
MPNRNYNYSDVHMLIAGKTIAGSLRANLQELSAINTTWTLEYVDGLENKFDFGFDKYLGLDSKKDLREATRKLIELQNPTQRNLSIVKTKIEVDFKPQAKEWFKILGYEKYYRKVLRGGQEALIQMLFTFRDGMTESIKNQLVTKGLPVNVINELIDNANLVMEADAEQEKLKEVSRQVSAEAVGYFNELYEEISGVCKIAANFYMNDPLKKKLFTFSRIVGNMSSHHKGNGRSNEVEPTTSDN